MRATGGLSEGDCQIYSSCLHSSVPTSLLNHNNLTVTRQVASWGRLQVINLELLTQAGNALYAGHSLIRLPIQPTLATIEPIVVYSFLLQTSDR